MTIKTLLQSLRRKKIRKEFFAFLRWQNNKKIALKVFGLLMCCKMSNQTQMIIIAFVNGNGNVLWNETKKKYNEKYLYFFHLLFADY